MLSALLLYAGWTGDDGFRAAGDFTPVFWLGLLLIYFLALNYSGCPLPGYGNGGIAYLVLPAIARDAISSISGANDQSQYAGDYGSSTLPVRVREISGIFSDWKTCILQCHHTDHHHTGDGLCQLSFARC